MLNITTVPFINVGVFENFKTIFNRARKFNTFTYKMMGHIYSNFSIEKEFSARFWQITVKLKNFQTLEIMGFTMVVQEIKTRQITNRFDFKRYFLIDHHCKTHRKRQNLLNCLQGVMYNRVPAIMYF